VIAASRIKEFSSLAYENNWGWWLSRPPSNARRAVRLRRDSAVADQCQMAHD